MTHAVPTTDDAATKAVIPALHQQAIDELVHLIEEARSRGAPEANVAALATAGPDARPSVRIVNLARVSASGLVFFAHALSGKGQQLRSNPRAALCFHWPLLSYEVIVEGSVAELPAADADGLWRGLPRDYTLGHWASDQNEPVPSDAVLHESVRAASRRFASERPSRPEPWQAFELHPDRIDFWPTGWQRLHTHREYRQDQDGAWRRESRSP